jgi:hypothetical protein
MKQTTQLRPKLKLNCVYKKKTNINTKKQYTLMGWFGLWCLTSLSTICQLYHGGQIYWWRRKLPTYRKSLTNFIAYCCIKYISPWTGSELPTLAVIGTDCTCSSKSNYNAMTATNIYWGKLPRQLCCKLHIHQMI